MFLRMFFFHLFFRMSSHCWLCHGTFGNRRELRLHVASAPHFRLRVVCPWCVGIERTSNRMADFKKHVNVKHSGVGVSNDFFSEASGFYLALYPTDYARVINPIPMTSPTAQTAIHAVRLWLRGANSSRSASEWEAGWNLGSATPPWEEAQAIPASPVPATPVQPYSPTHPQMTASDMTLRNVQEKDDQIDIDVELGGSLFVVVLNSSVKLLITMGQLQQQIRSIQPRPVGKLADVRGTSFEEVAGKVSSQLGVSEVFVDQVQMLVPTPGRLPIPFPTCNPQPVQPGCLPQSSQISAARKPGQEAAQLLSWGMLPLLPPGRRNWDQDEAVTLTGRNHSVKWPPSGWRTFTAERRLQVFEFAAGLLDADLTGFPVTSRSDLLDKYNFMALPGSMPPQQGPKSAMRPANYQQLRAIATGEEPDLRLLKTYRNASQDRDDELDHLIRVVDGAGIPLRLER